MPNKTIYIREGDQELWEKAEKLSNGSLSGLLADFIRRYVAEREERRGEMERIVIEHWDKAVEKTRRKAFVGRWLIEPDSECRSGEPGADMGICYAVAETKNGNFAFYWFHKNNSEYQSGFEVFETLEDAREQYPDDIIEAALSEHDPEHVEELDI